jgi:hypothetical protein
MIYVLVGKKTGDPLSYKGQVIVHSSRVELEYLFPESRVEPAPGWVLTSPTIQLKDHPDMNAVQFPIAEHMDQFR